MTEQEAAALRAELKKVDDNANKLIDQVNAGRSLLHYAQHYEYCPHFPSGRITRALAAQQKGTCNCGLAEFVNGAFGS